MLERVVLVAARLGMLYGSIVEWERVLVPLSGLRLQVSLFRVLTLVWKRTIKTGIVRSGVPF